MSRQVFVVDLTVLMEELTQALLIDDLPTIDVEQAARQMLDSLEYNNLTGAAYDLAQHLTTGDNLYTFEDFLEPADNQHLETEKQVKEYIHTVLYRFATAVDAKFRELGMYPTKHERYALHHRPCIPGSYPDGPEHTLFKKIEGKSGSPVRRQLRSDRYRY